jgi:hypothetical protein
MSLSQKQWERKSKLLLVAGGKGLDLSEFRFTFQTQNQDAQSPANAAIRVYNLDSKTIAQIRGEFSDVLLQAGYVNAGFGTIFKGTIRQYAVGKESATDSYLDILAADGDIGYNYGVVNRSLPRGALTEDAITSAVEAMGTSDGYMPNFSGTESLRGKVLFGMARDVLKEEANQNACTWSIQDGKVVFIPLNKYIPGDVVKINSLTGMIGIPELTDQGVSVRTLLNPNVKIGYLIQLDNKTVNQLFQQNADNPIPYNQYTGIQRLASVSADGLYRVYAAEHTGDTRGQPWYTDIVCLAVNKATDTVEPYSLGAARGSP